MRSYGYSPQLVHLVLSCLGLQEERNGVQSNPNMNKNNNNGVHVKPIERIGFE